MELYLCRHLDWEFTVLVYKEHDTWVILAPSETYYLSTYGDVKRILGGFESCELVEKSRYIPRSKVKTMKVGLR